jgi:hypothetical protein
MPTKKWVNWSQVKHPLPYNFNPKFPKPIRAKPVPEKLVERVGKAIRLIEKAENVRLTGRERDDREIELANNLAWIDFWKEYERKKPSPSVEKERLLDRSRALRAANVALTDEICHLTSTDTGTFE